MTKQKGFLKDVTDDTVKSILHPKKYLRERAEQRSKINPKPYIPISGPDKWIADITDAVKSKYKIIEDYINEQQQQRKKDGLRYYENGKSHNETNINKPINKTTQYLKPEGEVNQKVVEWQKYLKPEGFDVGGGGN